MHWVNTECRIPIKSWCEDVEGNAMYQAANLAKHPATVSHVALMPDCHAGYGMPIGGVIATRDVIIPNAVGVDIGCGMCAVKTDVAASDLATTDIKEVMGDLRKVIPVGFKHHQDEQEWVGFDRAPDIPVIQQELQAARRQLGTLGGGNHFVELQESDDDRLWLMLHSGSRNFGLKIANVYHKAALNLCQQWYSELPDPELAFLPLAEDVGQDYVTAMNYALEFAAENRRLMMYRAMGVLEAVLDCRFENEIINVHHNYAALEHHFNKNVYIHRKGATAARAGQLGIIPGSMGTPSYIVEGLGNPQSFQSCSHGAGRRMGRMQASRELTVEEADRAMEGVVFGRWGTNRKGSTDLGEAPQAYKDIDEVMASQADLVRPLVKLRPRGVIKG